MASAERQLYRPALFSVITLLVLLIFSACFYRERVFFSDASYVVFDIINYQKLDIQNLRFGSFITQLVPLLEAKLGLPIQTILFSYSISFSAFFLATGLLLTYWYRTYALAIIYTFFSCLIITSSFYWISELFQGVSWLFLFLAEMSVARSNAFSKIARYSRAFIFLFLALFSHFVILIPAVFLLVYFLIDNQNSRWYKRQILVSLTAIVLITLAKFWFASSGSAAESLRLHGITHFSIKDIIDSFSSNVVTTFLGRCGTIYWTSIPIFLLGLLSLFKNRKWRAAAWCLVSFAGYLIIMGLTYTDDDGKTQLFHIESEWSSISIIFATPFVLSLLPSIKSSLSSLIVVVFFAVRVFFTYQAVKDFQPHIQIQQQIMASMKRMKIHKLAIIRDAAVAQKYRLDWASGYESILLSAFTGDTIQRTFCFVSGDDSAMIHKLKVSKTNILLWDMASLSTLNPQYFHVDTAEVYQVMNYNDLAR